MSSGISRRKLWPFCKRRPRVSIKPSNRSRPLIWAAACASFGKGGVIVSQKRTNRASVSAEMPTIPLQTSASVATAGRDAARTLPRACPLHPATETTRPPLPRSPIGKASCGRQDRRSASEAPAGNNIHSVPHGPHNSMPSFGSSATWRAMPRICWRRMRAWPAASSTRRRVRWRTLPPASGRSSPWRWRHGREARVRGASRCWRRPLPPARFPLSSTVSGVCGFIADQSVRP